MTQESTLEIGSVVEGTVSGVTHFGAFVSLSNGKIGLVHISEVANTFVRDIGEFLKPDDRVRVKVLSLDDRGRVSLSIKQANPEFRSVPPRRESRSGTTFEDKLAKFLKESQDRMADLQRIEGKRGGRGSRASFGDS